MGPPPLPSSNKSRNGSDGCKCAGGAHACTRLNRVINTSPVSCNATAKPSSDVLAADPVIRPTIPGAANSAKARPKRGRHKTTSEVKRAWALAARASSSRRSCSSTVAAMSRNRDARLPPPAAGFARQRRSGSAGAILRAVEAARTQNPSRRRARVLAQPVATLKLWSLSVHDPLQPRPHEPNDPLPAHLQARWQVRLRLRRAGGGSARGARRMRVSPARRMRHPMHAPVSIPPMPNPAIKPTAPAPAARRSRSLSVGTIPSAPARRSG